MLNTCLYHKGKPFETNISRAEMLSAVGDKESLLWVDIESPTEFESECLVEIFNFHPLAVEDCLSDHSEPKVDDYEEYLFLVMHAATVVRDEGKKTEELSTIELNIFFGKNYVVTFHKNPVRAVEHVRETVKKKPSYYMASGSDFLVHAILDHLIDNYQPILDHYDDKIDQLEEEIFNNPPANYLSTLMQVKRDIFHLRRMVAPQRDTVNYLTRNPTPFIRRKNMMYFRDVYDHLVRIHKVAESFHEMLSSILQVYFSYSSTKLNEVVKHMTVLATLTMPSIIIASIYGMNFQHMPELSWKFGYPFSMALAIGVSASMLLWMKSKKWI